MNGGIFEVRCVPDDTFSLIGLICVGVPVLVGIGSPGPPGEKGEPGSFVPTSGV